MERNLDQLSLGPEGDDDDEIEILEVVGLDEDSPAGRVTAEGGQDDETEVTVDFDQASGEGTPRVSDRERFERLRADFENYKKRIDREREATMRHASAELVTRLLPVLDNFERAFSTALPSEDGRAFQQGVALIFRQLLDELRREGLVAVDSLGQAFDPRLHEAVATEKRSGLPENSVVEEIRRGYLLHERLLRPAQVRVAVEEAVAAPGSESKGER